MINPEQGFGRLIWTWADRGIVVILDPPGHDQAIGEDLAQLATGMPANRRRKEWVWCTTTLVEVMAHGLQCYNSRTVYFEYGSLFALVGPTHRRSACCPVRWARSAGSPWGL